MNRQKLANFFDTRCDFGWQVSYVLFYNLSYYVENPFHILRIWDGGMAFHGGFGVVVAVTFVVFE